ncbi:MAG: hypothetical protein FWG55_09615 [Candidatus Bathyarchaeota archaeon]|nr:hypothetical protein [Candidatus Termiticorpusculum sp.]
MRIPAIKMSYLNAFTDDTGIFQHARHCIPKRGEGYTTDDNARALVVCAQHSDIKNDQQINRLANIYLAFLNYMQKPNGSFHNYLGYDRRFLDVDGSEDCLGRALWSCGRTMNSRLSDNAKLVAKEIFYQALPYLDRSTSLRACSFAIFGLYNCYKDKPDENMFAKIEKLADRMVQQYQNETKPEWHWFEPYLTYDNARLSQALFDAYIITKKQSYLDVAQESLHFIIDTQIIDEKFVPIGNNGWYTYGGQRAVYDQQPLEAAALVDATADAYYATQQDRYLEMAILVFEWFLGRNTRKRVMYNTKTGGCFDGLNVDLVNMNQGAESSLSYLMARIKLYELQQFSKTKELVVNI